MPLCVRSGFPPELVFELQNTNVSQKEEGDIDEEDDGKEKEEKGKDTKILQEYDSDGDRQEVQKDKKGKQKEEGLSVIDLGDEEKKSASDSDDDFLEDADEPVVVIPELPVALCKRYATKDNRTVDVCYGNLTFMATDVIVNPANGLLRVNCHF